MKRTRSLRRFGFIFNKGMFMSNHDSDAHKHLASNTVANQISDGIRRAIEKSANGRYIVATADANEVLVLSHFNASTRDDLNWLYDSEFGYVFSKRSA
jgi:hypothetical protein